MSEDGRRKSTPASAAACSFEPANNHLGRHGLFLGFSGLLYKCIVRGEFRAYGADQSVWSGSIAGRLDIYHLAYRPDAGDHDLSPEVTAVASG